MSLNPSPIWFPAFDDTGMPNRFRCERCNMDFFAKPSITIPIPAIPEACPEELCEPCLYIAHPRIADKLPYRSRVNRLALED